MKPKIQDPTNKVALSVTKNSGFVDASWKVIGICPSSDRVGQTSEKQVQTSVVLNAFKLYINGATGESHVISSFWTHFPLTRARISEEHYPVNLFRFLWFWFQLTIGRAKQAYYFDNTELVHRLRLGKIVTFDVEESIPS